MAGAGRNLDVLILPKITAPRDVWFFDTLLSQLEAKLRLPRSIGFEILIEETEALARVEELAGCCPRLEALILGVGDLSASQGIRLSLLDKPGYPGDLWHYARNRMIVAARAHRLDAIDGPFANFRDPEGYRRQAVEGSILGCVGKWAIHPSQIEIANDVFAPTAEEIERARVMCEAYEASERGGAGSGDVGGVLIDAATHRIYRAVLERGAPHRAARLLGALGGRSAPGGLGAQPRRAVPAAAHSPLRPGRAKATGGAGRPRRPGRGSPPRRAAARSGRAGPG